MRRVFKLNKSFELGFLEVSAQFHWSIFIAIFSVEQRDQSAEERIPECWRQMSSAASSYCFLYNQRNKIVSLRPNPVFLPRHVRKTCSSHFLCTCHSFGGWSAAKLVADAKRKGAWRSACDWACAFTIDYLLLDCWTSNQIGFQVSLNDMNSLKISITNPPIPYPVHLHMCNNERSWQASSHLP